MKLLVTIVQQAHVLLNNNMENITLKFEFSIDEANVLLAALQELPAKVANPLSAKIQQQARPQLPQPEEQVGLELVK